MTIATFGVERLDALGVATLESLVCETTVDEVWVLSAARRVTAGLSSA
jgi:hypothetical protein